MRCYTPRTLAYEYRKRHCESIALVLELIEEAYWDICFPLCISTDGQRGGFVYIEDPFSFFQSLLFKEEGRRMVIFPYSIPSIEESCRDLLFLLHNETYVMH